MKKILFVVLAIMAGETISWAQTPTQSIMDVDAMAARMKTEQDIYKKVRDESLAVFGSQAKDHADDKMKALIRMSVYLCLWGDFYGEGMWQLGKQYEEDAAVGAASRDPLRMVFSNMAGLHGFHSADENDALRINYFNDIFLASAYPTELKLMFCSTDAGNLVAYKVTKHPPTDATSIKIMPALIEHWGENYRQFLKEKPSHNLAYDLADRLLCLTQQDETTLNLAIAEIDRSFNEIDSNNPVKIALDGEYYTDAAWCARGSGWANDVTDQGWKVFAERLLKADQILEAGYAKYPAEGEMARAMIAVELGQGHGRDRMEMWFQRAIKVNPDDYDAYKAKEWYLQPRWYGSVDDILAFGQECEKGGNWSAKLPTILTTGIAEASQTENGLYKRDDVWVAVEKTYREYLEHYPNGIFFRTSFAKHAYDSGHRDIALEQFRILGNNWDHSTVSDEEYQAIAVDLGLK